VTDDEDLSLLIRTWHRSVARCALFRPIDIKSKPFALFRSQSPQKRRNLLFHQLRNLAFVAACLFPSLAAAHTFSLPKENPTITVAIPDYLEPTDTLRGAEGGVSQDRTFNVLVEPMDGADAKTAADQCFDMLMTHGVVADPKSVKQTSRQVNGLDATDFSFTIEQGRENAGFTLIATRPGANFMAVLYYGSNEGLKANSEGLASLIGSIQPIKK
jgi:hypothetical protein